MSPPNVIYVGGCSGPYTCSFPDPDDHRAGDRWCCPGCGAEYRLSRPKPWRWWRRWAAPRGAWKLRRAWQWR